MEQKVAKQRGRREQRVTQASNQKESKFTEDETDESGTKERQGKKVDIPKLIVHGFMSFSNETGTLEKGVDYESEEELMALAKRSPHFNKRSTLPLDEEHEVSESPIIYKTHPKNMDFSACLDALNHQESGVLLSSSGSGPSETWTHNNGYTYDTNTGIALPLSSTSTSLPGINIQKKEVTPSVKSQSDSSIVDRSQNLYIIDEKSRGKQEEQFWVQEESSTDSAIIHTESTQQHKVVNGTQASHNVLIDEIQSAHNVLIDTSNVKAGGRLMNDKDTEKIVSHRAYDSAQAAKIASKSCKYVS